MGTVTADVAVAPRPRSFVRVAGRDAEDYLQRMVSNDVAALAPGESCEALLLTAKARVIATLVVLRRAPDDFLLLTEPALGGVVRGELLRSRFAAKAEIELEDHDSLVVLGTAPVAGLAVPTRDYGIEAVETIDVDPPPGARTLGPDELEVLRIRAGTPRFGFEIDDRVLPAEAGLDERTISFTKGCYPGQEPVARLRYRGHVNRRLRRLEIEGEELPAPDASIVHEGREVGRVTSSARSADGIVALGYVRVDVPSEAPLAVGPARARTLD